MNKKASNTRWNANIVCCVHDNSAQRLGNALLSNNTTIFKTIFQYIHTGSPVLTDNSSTSTNIHNLSQAVSHTSSISGSAESDTSTHEDKTQHTLTNLHLEGS